MRRLVIATTLAASLAPLAALEASAATGIATQRTKSHTLGCEITQRNHATYILIRNTTSQSIPVGTRITTAIVVAGNRTVGVRKTVSVRPFLSAGRAQAFLGAPSGATSCSATVQLIPDYYRR